MYLQVHIPSWRGKVVYFNSSGLVFHQSPYTMTTPTSLSYPLIHPSIHPRLSKPAVCDFPHMQSCCLLHCFVFKGGDCLSKPREMAKPEIICIITTSCSIQMHLSFLFVWIFFPSSLSFAYLSTQPIKLCTVNMLVTTVSSFFRKEYVAKLISLRLEQIKRKNINSCVL